MAELILLERINKLGAIGDIVNVKNGYARYLLRFDKALRATEEKKTEFENKRTEFEKENLNKKSVAEEIVKKIENTELTLVRQAGEDGRLFGSVTSKDVAEAFDKLNIKVERSCIQLNNVIKNMGIFDVNVALHADVNVKISLNVTRSDDKNIENN